MERGRLERRRRVALRAIRGLLWGSVLALAGALPAAAAAQGPEFQVNTYTTSYQSYPSVAADSDGDFVVVWNSFGSSGTDTSSNSVQGQRYASNGTALGGQFQVNTYTTSYQSYPSVAADSDGDFVVVWDSGGSSGTDTSAYSVQGQRYASDGTALGGQFQVNTYTTSSQYSSSVAVESDGDFVVVWESVGSSGTDTSSYSVQGQRYASNGTALGGQFQVNTYTTSFQSGPSVAADADGDFVVVWDSGGSSGSDTSGSSIQGQRYASDGTALGGEFQVNTFITSNQVAPSVAARANGDFVVVWHSSGSSGTDTSSRSVQGQRYASNGTALGGEFQVNTYTTSYQNFPSVAADANGDFVVVWNSFGSSGTDTSLWSVEGQRYASDGTTLGGEFQVNTYTTDAQFAFSVAAGADGAFVVAWQSSGSYGNDTSSASIQARRNNDGVDDAVDNCTDVANPGQVDSDGDGCGNACDADFNQDGLIGGPDFFVLKSCFGQSVPGSGPAGDPTCAESDLTGDLVVGGPDFFRLKAGFGKPPGPGAACPF